MTEPFDSEEFQRGWRAGYAACLADMMEMERLEEETEQCKMKELLKKYQ